MDVDSETMASVVKRLRRAQGQIGGVIKKTAVGRRRSLPGEKPADAAANHLTIATTVPERRCPAG